MWMFKAENCKLKEFSACINSLLYFVNDSFESLGIVHGQVGEHLTVDFDTGFVDEAHKLAVRKIFHSCSGVDTLYPECAEVAFLLFAVAIGIGQTFFPCIFRYCPNVSAATIITAGKFQNFFSFCT